jgi:3-hydroxybutyryl-CoA dehydrogenase
MSAHIDKAAEWLLNQGQPGSQIVGVIGAGTMGAGIAQVAAASGHPVMLMDARSGAAAALPGGEDSVMIGSAGC